MHDLFTTRVGDQINFLEGAFVSYCKRLALQTVVAEIPWLFAIPVIGPIAQLLVGRLIGKVLSWLARNGELQAYYANSRRRADEQAKRFDELVDARENSQTAEELKHAEKLALESFDGVVKYSR